MFWRSKIRNNNKDKMYSGTGTFNNFHDLSAINGELGEETQTIELFSMLSERFPEQAKRFYHAVEDLLIQKQEFKLVEKYMEDPIFKYENLRQGAAKRGTIEEGRRYAQAPQH